MAIKIKSVDKGLFKMEKTAKDLDGRKINVGYLQGGEQAWLAAIHEYGCVIKITPKMRNWLHANGLHVKNTTKEIVIPERSYLRAGFDEHHKQVIDVTNLLVADVLGGTMPVDKFCEIVGTELRSKIQDYADELSDPKNHPFTIERKGSANPLVDSGDMINSLDFEVEK